MRKISGANVGPSNTFRDASPGNPATDLTPDWCNDLQADLIAIQEAGGQSEGAGSDGRVLAAIRSLIAQAVPASVVGDVIDVTGTTQISVALTSAALREASTGDRLVINSLSVTIDAGTSGAGGLDTGSIAPDTFYAVHAIAKKSDGTKHALLSLSDTAPTLPSGYTNSTRVAWVLTDGSGNLIGTIQRRRRAQYKPGVNLSALRAMASGTAGNPTGPTWVPVAWGAYMPSTAAALLILLDRQDVAGDMALAPNNSYGIYRDTSNPPPYVASSTNATALNIVAEIVPESADVYWYANNSSHKLRAVGWIDNF